MSKILEWCFNVTDTDDLEALEERDTGEDWCSSVGRMEYGWIPVMDWEKWTHKVILLRLEN